MVYFIASETLMVSLRESSISKDSMKTSTRLTDKILNISSSIFLHMSSFYTYTYTICILLLLLLSGDIIILSIRYNKRYIYKACIHTYCIISKGKKGPIYFKEGHGEVFGDAENQLGIALPLFARELRCVRAR